MTAKLPSLQTTNSHRTAFFTATLFVFFLTASAPHRVHHLFEKIAHSSSQQGKSEGRHNTTGKTGSTNNQRSNQDQSDCPIQQTAQSCQFGPCELLSLPLPHGLFNESPEEAPVSFGPLTPLRLSPRAPPPGWLIHIL